MSQYIVGDPNNKEKRVPMPMILFRSSGVETEDEFLVANKHFVTSRSRMNVTGGDLVIPRYSALPFYTELESDVCSNGARLINTYNQHRYVADIKNWVGDLEGLTPRTWKDCQSVPRNISVVLKGETNSRKNKWKTHMFAKNHEEMLKVWCVLQTDDLLSDQDIYIREFVPLKTYLINPITEQPITEEYRFFVLDGKVMSSGYYWANHLDEISETPNPANVPQEFLDKVISIIKDKIRFVVVDVARTASGEWIVIELNDGQQAGLSNNDPETLYRNMKHELWSSKTVIKS